MYSIIILTYLFFILRDDDFLVRVHCTTYAHLQGICFKFKLKHMFHHVFELKGHIPSRNSVRVLNYILINLWKFDSRMRKIRKRTTKSLDLIEQQRLLPQKKNPPFKSSNHPKKGHEINFQANFRQSLLKLQFKLYHGFQ